MSLITGCFVRLSLKLGIPTERIKSYPGSSVHFPSSPHGCQIRKTVWQNRLAKPKGARLLGTVMGWASSTSSYHKPHLCTDELVFKPKSELVSVHH
jgi:hypothetical protein